MSWRNCYSEEISIKLTEDRFAPRSVNTGVWGSLMNERISMECKVGFKLDIRLQLYLSFTVCY